MRLTRTLWFAASLIAVMSLIGQATDRDEAVLTVKVSSAEHELVEGYFSLGDAATLMVKPGTELHRFLARQRGKSVKITFAEETGRQLSSVER